METARRMLLPVLVTFVLVLAAAPARAADVDGKWSGSLDTPMGAVQVGFTFKADGAALTGTTTGPDGAEVPIKNGKIDGDKISFVVTIDFGGMMFDLNYTGVVAADTAKLTIDFMGMPMSFDVKKAK
jgi:hypothetical protein